MKYQCEKCGKGQVELKGNAGITIDGQKIGPGTSGIVTERKTIFHCRCGGKLVLVQETQ